MNRLKVETTIHCDTCMVPLKRTKTIKVSAETQAEAQQEARAELEKWKESLKGKNCKCCQSIIDDLAA